MKNKNKFTLIELIVVIVVLGILAAIVIPNINSFSKDAKTSALEADARTIELAIDMYSLKNNGSVPTLDGTPVGKGEEKEEVNLDLLTGYFKKDSQFKDKVTFYLEESGTVTYELGENSDEEVSVGPNAGTAYEHIKDKKIESANIENDFNTSPLGDGVKITGYKGTATDIIIPESINGKPVTMIEQSAFFPKSKNIFSGKSSVTATSVVIPSSVTSIGRNAFLSNQLKEIVIPNKTEMIDYGAFANNQLEEVNIPSSVNTLVGSAFHGTQKPNFYLGKNNTKYKVGSDNKSIYSKDGKTIVLGKEEAFGTSDYSKVTKIGEYAFLGAQLTSIVIPKSVTTIERGGFQENKLTNITIPNSVTIIGVGAFSRNQLTNLTIPNSVTTIGGSAFYSNQLTSISIPNSVTSIGGAAFWTNKLTSVTLPNSITTIESSLFNDNQITSITIPNSVTTIKSMAFEKNQLTNLIIPDSVTTIEAQAFSKNNITNLTIGSKVSSIGTFAFSDNQLTSLSIPNNVTALDGAVFYSNPNLKTVSAPSHLGNISDKFNSNPTINYY